MEYGTLTYEFVSCTNNFFACHGLSGHIVDFILEQFRQFLSENPNEVLILEFKKLYKFGAEQHNILAEKIEQTFGELLVFPTVGVSVTYNQLRAKGKSVFIWYDDFKGERKRFKWLWRTRWYQSPWPETCDVSDMKEFLENAISKRPSKKFHVTQCVLTPVDETIINGLKPGRPSTIKDFIADINPEIIQWISSDCFDKDVNILMMDFYEHTKLVDLAIDLNIARFLETPSISWVNCYLSVGCDEHMMLEYGTPFHMKRPGKVYIRGYNIKKEGIIGFRQHRFYPILDEFFGDDHHQISFVFRNVNNEELGNKKRDFVQFGDEVCLHVVSENTHHLPSASALGVNRIVNGHHDHAKWVIESEYSYTRGPVNPDVGFMLRHKNTGRILGDTEWNIELV
eukprot:TRINITY_DN1745_c0_g2_i1.p1 TRINITY_DN1745_c0_g2~~TRINITY_DN1745_c0_g2_i1.p1  ORF type:complete len:397 (+),score=67.18 TRINITY_DN1745_c0_g2_i1:319-1509(+)